MLSCFMRILEVQINSLQNESTILSKHRRLIRKPPRVKHIFIDRRLCPGRRLRTFVRKRHRDRSEAASYCAKWIPDQKKILSRMANSECIAARLIGADVQITATMERSCTIGSAAAATPALYGTASIVTRCVGGFAPLSTSHGGLHGAKCRGPVVWWEDASDNVRVWTVPYLSVKQWQLCRGNLNITTDADVKLL